MHLQTRYRRRNPLIQWQVESLARVDDYPHFLWPLADAKRVPRIVKKFPHLFENWTADDFHEAEARFWSRFPSVMFNAEQLFRVIAGIIKSRKKPRPDGTHLDFAEPLDDCYDVPRVLAARQLRTRDAGTNANDFGK